MSLDYSLFLRDKPDLSSRAGKHGLVKKGDSYTLGGMRLSVGKYEPDEDALEEHPWRDEITWVISASGKQRGKDADSFHALMEELGTAYRGGLWCDHEDGIEWFWWDRGALATQVAAMEPTELLDFMAAAAGELRDEVGVLAAARIATIKPLKKQQTFAMKLWSAIEDEDDPLAAKIGDALLAVDARGNSKLADAQHGVLVTRDRAVAAAMPIPEGADIAAMLADSAEDTIAQLVLQRGVDARDKDFSRGLADALLVRARSGGEPLRWMRRLPAELDAAPEHDKGKRAAFAAKGALAKAIVDEWNRADAYVEMTNDLLERRRRAGEMYAGIPADIRSLAKTDREGAVAEYARRYGLAVDKARQIVEVNS